MGGRSALMCTLLDQAIVLTPEEFQERRELPFLQGVLLEAKPLYERGKAPA
ncbi:DNA polymerase beta domain-containing protein region [Thermus thermophilus]|nr:DNA polymerase beta domain-containing protein region [Thermus thermophilus]BDB11198.1 hypothetical protein TthTMY_09370 [Thermus thermophilus]